MNRRSFLGKLCALVAAPFAAVALALRPEAADYSRITWPTIPIGPADVVGRYLLRTETAVSYAWRHRLHQPSPPQSPLYWLAEAERKARRT
jgi:hypothetical protein